MKNEEIIFATISIIAGLVVLSTLAWVFLKYPSEQVGDERFVMDEITIIPGLNHFKPITIIIISAFACWLCALEALREYIIKLPILIKRLIFISSCVIAFVFSYEVLWNFFMWASAHVLNPNLPLDLLSHQFNPSMTHPRNFVYATKLYSLILASSLYSIFFLYTNMEEKTYKQK
jgi:glucan phosphoethanolaminetransferase (alkaline phosphatase superfamily)